MILTVFRKTFSMPVIARAKSDWRALRSRTAGGETGLILNCQRQSSPGTLEIEIGADISVKFDNPYHHYDDE